MASDPSASASSLPAEIVQAIAVANANSVGLQPAILANLALANQIFNNNLQQQILLTQQQALNQLVLATVAKCVSLIADAETQDLRPVHELIALLKTMTPAQPSASPVETVETTPPAA